MAALLDSSFFQPKNCRKHITSIPLPLLKFNSADTQSSHIWSRRYHPSTPLTFGIHPSTHFGGVNITISPTLHRGFRFTPRDSPGFPGCFHLALTLRMCHSFLALCSPSRSAPWIAWNDRLTQPMAKTPKLFEDYIFSRKNKVQTFIARYCWWKKSCTPPGMYKTPFWYLTGAGFLPSTIKRQVMTGIFEGKTVWTKHSKYCRSSEKVAKRVGNASRGMFRIATLWFMMYLWLVSITETFSYLKH